MKGYCNSPSKNYCVPVLSLNSSNRNGKKQNYNNKKTTHKYLRDILEAKVTVVLGKRKKNFEGILA